MSIYAVESPGGFVHRIALAFCLIVSTASCAHRPIATATDFDAAYPEPLSVRLLAPDNGRLRFLTSEPAFVAIFEIVQGPE